VVAYLVVSFIHRVFLQRWWGATLGRALTGLRTIDPRTQRPPTVGRLAVGCPRSSRRRAACPGRGRLPGVVALAYLVAVLGRQLTG
jgi:hypothetical protein